MFLRDEETPNIWNPAFVERVRDKRRRIAKALAHQARLDEGERVAAQQEQLLAGKPLALDVIRVIAERHGVTMGDILSYRRGTKVDDVRKIAIRAVMRYRPDLTPSQIGRIFGKHRTTVVQTTKGRRRYG